MTIFILLCGLIFNVVYSGFVFSMLWGWFVVPLGVTSISIPWGIGLMLLLTSANYRSVLKDDESMLGDFLTSLCSTTIFLVIGFIAHKFM